MSIQIGKYIFEIVCDQCGNIYFDDQKQLYEIMITSKNKIELEVARIEYNYITSDTRKLKLKRKTLKDKIIEEKNNDEYDSDEYNSNDEKEEEKDQKDIMFVNEYTKEDDIYYDDTSDNEDIYLLGNGIKTIEALTEPPLYDAIIYDKDKPIFVTKNIDRCYRINITPDEIRFRPIGENEQIYTFILSNNQLEIKEVTK